MAGQFRFKNNSGTVVAQISASNAGAISFSGSAVDFSSVATLTLGTSTLTGTASFATTAVSSSYASNALTGSNAMTASSADTLYVRNNITTLGSITAQTLVVQTVTSSVLFSTGSNKLGSSLSNTQELTGSVGITGSLSVVTTGTEFQVNAGGVNIGNALTDSHIISGSITINPNGLFVSSSGNVGIGTITPLALLHVGAGSQTAVNLANTKIIIANSGNSGRAALLTLANDSSGNSIEGQFESSGDSAEARIIFGSSTNHPLTFRTNNSERMRITSTGNVGIGTTSPGSILAISSSVTADNLSPESQVTITNTSSGNHSTLGFRTTDSDGTHGRAGITVVKDSGSITGAMNFVVRQNSGTFLQAMRIDSSGNVYIGTTDPNATNFGMALLANGEIDISRSSGTNFVMNRSTTNGQIIDFRYNNTQVGSISTNSNSLPSDLNFKKDISDISIGLNLITKLRPVHYRHKMDEDDEALSNGIIAQELEQSLLDCGIEKNSLLMLQHKPNEKENESQYWVDYTKMIPVLVKAIQELKAEIDILKQT